MTDLYYFPMLVGDWLSGEAVSTMTPEQEGAFIHLLCHAWQAKDVPCSLSDDDNTLARLSRLGKRWKTVGALVRAQFHAIDGDPSHIRNPKLYEVYVESVAKHEKRVRAGEAGGNAKAKAKQSPSNATATPEQCSSNQNHSHNQSTTTTKTKATKADDQLPLTPDLELVPADVNQRTVPDEAKAAHREWVENVGHISFAAYVKATKPMVDADGWADTRNGQRAYWELTEGRAQKVIWMVENAAKWIRLGKMGLIDPETDAWTERGRLVELQIKRSM